MFPQQCVETIDAAWVGPWIAFGPVFERVLLDDPCFGYNELVVLLIWHDMPDTDCTGSVDLHTVEKKYQLPFFSIVQILCFFPSKWSVSFCFPVWAVIDQPKFDFSPLQRLTFSSFCSGSGQSIVFVFMFMNIFALTYFWNPEFFPERRSWTLLSLILHLYGLWLILSIFMKYASK